MPRTQSPPDEEFCRSLIQDYPFKGYQLKLLGLDSVDMVEHHLARLTREGARALSVSSGDTSGLISFSPNAYLAHHLDRPAFRLDNFLRTHYDDQDLSRAMGEEIVACEESDGFLEAWLPLGDVVGIQGLQRVQFYQVGVEIRLARTLDASYAPSYPEDLDLRVYQPEDEPALMDLVADYHEKNRFGCDPGIDADVRKRIYVKELSSLLESPNIRCNTYFEDGKLVGFNTGKINRQLSERTGKGYGSLDLIVLHPGARRKGAGIGLSLMAAEWLRDQGVQYVACRTMASNYPAIALLHTLGFRIVFAKSILHRWS